jgi:hypothetical protein
MNCESISVHIRRGDYVTDPTINKVHGTCSVPYYKIAINRFKTLFENPRFFIFSDDLKWVEDNLCIENFSTFISHNGYIKDYEDLRLMSLCKHHIIANSSFSWWGAWLCENSNKIVLAPKKWFNNELNEFTYDLIPTSWIRI